MNILEACAEIMKDVSKVYEGIYYTRETECKHTLKRNKNCRIVHLTEGDIEDDLQISAEIMKIDFKLKAEPVDFMTAINSDKKIYPVKYFEDVDEKSYKEAVRVMWTPCHILLEFAKDKTEPEILEYINGMWHIEE